MILLKYDKLTFELFLVCLLSLSVTIEAFSVTLTFLGIISQLNVLFAIFVLNRL